MRSRTLELFTLVALGVGLVAASAAAQAGRGTGRINGTVADEAGKAVAGAKITIVLAGNASIKRDVVTDKKGEWAILGLGTSQWTLTAEADGFLPVTLAITVKQLERNPAIAITLQKAGAGGEPSIRDDATLSLIDRADKLYKEGNIDEALAVFREIQAANPALYQVNLSIGDCLRQKNEIDQALEAYARVLEAAKTDPQNGKQMTAKALARIGECHLMKNDLETAQEFFKQSIEISPDDETLAYNVGEIYFSNQKLDEAVTYLSLATRIKPGWSQAHYKLGLAYLNKGDFESARQSLNKVLELEPEGELAAIVKGMLDAIDKIKK